MNLLRIVVALAMVPLSITWAVALPKIFGTMAVSIGGYGAAFFHGVLAFLVGIVVFIGVLLFLSVGIVLVGAVRRSNRGVLA